MGVLFSEYDKNKNTAIRLGDEKSVKLTIGDKIADILLTHLRIISLVENAILDSCYGCRKCLEVILKKQKDYQKIELLKELMCSNAIYSYSCPIFNDLDSMRKIRNDLVHTDWIKLMIAQRVAKESKESLQKMGIDIEVDPKDQRTIGKLYNEYYDIAEKYRLWDGSLEYWRDDYGA